LHKVCIQPRSWTVSRIKNAQAMLVPFVSHIRVLADAVSIRDDAISNGLDFVCSDHGRVRGRHASLTMLGKGLAAKRSGYQWTETGILPPVTANRECRLQNHRSYRSRTLTFAGVCGDSRSLEDQAAVRSCSSITSVHGCVVAVSSTAKSAAFRISTFLGVPCRSLVLLAVSPNEQSL
jgi:hypothetical protein